MTHDLVPHGAHRPDAAVAVTASVRRAPTALIVRFGVAGGDAICWPEPGQGQRRDELWRTTCFEAFLRPAGARGYVEVNASPSTDWAAYTFDNYRDGMRNAPIEVTVAPDGRCSWIVSIDMAGIPELASAPIDLSLTAVVALRDGTTAYFALCHPPGKPDFHHADCFAVRVEAPDAA